MKQLEKHLEAYEVRTTPESSFCQRTGKGYFADSGGKDRLTIIDFRLLHKERPTAKY
jgi:hypothetical protein